MQIIHTAPRRDTLPPSLAQHLPLSLCDAVERLRVGNPEELRLHAGRVATVTAGGKNHSAGVVLNEGQIKEILLRMCGGSLYAYRHTISQGYLTLPGGVRVGVCGRAAVEDGQVIGVSAVSGLMIRLPHTVRVCAKPILDLLRGMRFLRGILIYAPPGVGKTTLLRAVIREAAGGENGLRTVAVDTREELSCTLDGEDLRLDILVGYPRDTGLEIAVRCMGAQLVACDEIGGERDAEAILHAANCGVPLIATAHADSPEALLRRSDIRALHRAAVFGAYVGIARDPADGFRYTVTRYEDLPGADA